MKPALYDCSLIIIFVFYFEKHLLVLTGLRVTFDLNIAIIVQWSFEPAHEKACLLHKQKLRHRSAVINCTADQLLCFCYVDSAISLLPKSNISIL